MPKFIIICALPRSGSSLLMRIINEYDDTNIYGENFNCFSDLNEMYHKIKKTLNWNKSYYVPKNRTEYEQCNTHGVAWYNDFNINDTNKMFTTFICNVLNKNNQYLNIGFKEIRHGFITNNDFQHDELKAKEFQKFRDELLFFIDLFGEECKIIFLIRNSIQIVNSTPWNCFKNKENSIEQINVVINNYKNFSEMYPKNCMMIEYENLISNSFDVINKLSQFIEIKTNINKLLAPLNKTTK